MGDLVHMLSALQEASDHVPGLRIDWVAEEGFADIARLLPAVQRVLPVAQRRWRTSLLSRATRREISDFVRQLRTVCYDTIIDTQGLIKSAWITRLARCQPGGRWGYDWSSARESLASLVLDHRVHAPAQMPAIDRYRRVVGQALGYAPEGPPAALARQHRVAAMPPDMQAMQNDAVSHPGTVLFLPGTSRTEKSWPVSSWIELGQALTARDYAIAVAWGSTTEQAAAQAIVSGIGARARVMPRLPLGSIAKMMPFCAGCVGVDSGLMHLSVALGCPTVAIMSAAHLPRFSAERFAPFWAPHARVLAATPDQPSVSAQAAFDAWNTLHG